jgi:hypothetical protein
MHIAQKLHVPQHLLFCKWHVENESNHETPKKNKIIYLYNWISIIKAHQSTYI